MAGAIGISITNTENRIFSNLYNDISKLPPAQQTSLLKEINRMNAFKNDVNIKINPLIKSRFILNNIKEARAKINQIANQNNIKIESASTEDINSLDEEIKTLENNMPNTETEQTNPETEQTKPEEKTKKKKKSTTLENITKIVGLALPVGGLLYAQLSHDKQMKAAKSAMQNFDKQISFLQNSDSTPENQKKLDNLIKERTALSQNSIMSEAMNLTKKHFKQMEQQRRAVSHQSGLNLSNLSQLFTGNASRDPRNSQNDLNNLLNLQSSSLNHLI
jgi:hypothetical protein